MKSQQIMRSNVEDTHKKLVNEAKSVNVRSKLNHINLACEYLSKNSVVSIASVVRYLSSEGVKLTKRTIYNKRDGGNPYRELIDSWIEYSEFVHNRKPSTSMNGRSVSVTDMLNDKDLANIPDLTLRHKFSLMYAELRSLKSQINIIKEASSLPTIYPLESSEQIHSDSDLKLTDSFTLSHYEIEVLKSLLATNSLNLSYDDDGALISTSVIKRDEQLSMEGLQKILVKLVEKFEC